MGWWLTVDWMAPVKRSGKGLEEKGGWGLKVGLMMVVAVVMDSPEIGNNIKEIMASSSSSKKAIPSTKQALYASQAAGTVLYTNTIAHPQIQEPTMNINRATNWTAEDAVVATVEEGASAVLGKGSKYQLPSSEFTY
ncbi:hypothetical protein E3N88_26568 [Mikania micrantha]|uniref:Uncharacterized protein n=1 Tax=Mikania micrantha TaxID=192012 RepID=A0A5N6MV80_9ASTR|nr:hypothetical protein E3N88_26568 [Mikania micrantha]